MNKLLNLSDFPLHLPESDAYKHLVARCQGDLAKEGMFNLEGFVRPEALDRSISELSDAMDTGSFLHARFHNIYFKQHIDGLPDNHPALEKFETANRTLCADQITGNPVTKIYEWQPLIDFLAIVLGKERLYTMKDPLARANVMSYRKGEALNWHFDRSEFTTTLLLQAPEEGGVFEYRTGLRSEDDPNYDGVAALLAGKDPNKKSLNASPGTLNVFRGINTPHRVTRIEGDRERIIAVFSYYEQPGVVFSAEEQLGFYGRSS